MASLELRQVSKRFGDVAVLKDVSFDIADGQFGVLLGPSGCGKSTALRLIAGLESPDSGEVRIGSSSVNHLSPKDRDIAMVFQDYALYPHLSAFENIAFGLRARNIPPQEIRGMLDETAKSVGISELLERKPAELSGGQRQRVALARAIARKPRGFLFDEPLSNLDAKLRASMRAELKRLHRKLKTTCLYVTHDQVEAMTLGEKIILMNSGAVEQIGTPKELYYSPRNKFVAEFLGAIPMNFIAGRLTFDNGKPVFVSQTGASIRLPDSMEGSAQPAAGFLGLRPEHVSFLPAPEHFNSGLIADIEFSEFTGSDYVVDAELNGAKIRVVSASEVPAGAKRPLFFHEKWIYLF